MAKNTLKFEGEFMKKSISKKENMFDVNRENDGAIKGSIWERMGYSSNSSDIYSNTASASVKFLIYPSSTSEKLFEILMENYDKKTQTARITQDYRKKLSDVETVNMHNAIDIIKGMSYQFYDVKNFDGEMEEIILTYPVVVKVLESPSDIIIQFHDNFKDTFDKYFQI